MPVGSMPYLTRRGVPVRTDRSSSRELVRGCDRLGPRRMISSCSAALRMFNRPFR